MKSEVREFGEMTNLDKQLRREEMERLIFAAAFAEASNNDSEKSIYDITLCAYRAVDRYNQGLALELVGPNFGGDK